MRTEQRELMKDFVVFILTHGRAKKQFTYNALCAQGYTGRCVFVVDNEDAQADEYKERFGAENVYVFDKLEQSKKCDEVVRGDRRVIIYARNVCFEIARELGYTYFMELDDDYHYFGWRFDHEGHYLNANPHIHNLDEVFASMLWYYAHTPILTLAMAKNGDFIGGGSNQMLQTIGTKRKAMNSFICSTERPFKFQGRINEDVNAYSRQGQQGKIFMTIVHCSLLQTTTQKNSGGMTDVYNDLGTWIKSFSSVVVCPSGVVVTMLNSTHPRIHHNVLWDRVAPKILSEKWQKK